MCDQVSEHIERLEALCANQRAALEAIFAEQRRISGWRRIFVRSLVDLIIAIETASSATGTDESGGEK